MVASFRNVGITTVTAANAGPHGARAKKLGVGDALILRAALPVSMRVAQVCLRFGAPGGVETHVEALSRELAKRGHEVTVFTSDLVRERPFERGASFPAPPEGVEVVRLPARAGRRAFPFVRFDGLARALRDARPDVIHAHSHRYHHVLVAAREARRLGVPFVLTPHYHPIEADAPRWKHAGAALVDALHKRVAYRHAARVLTVTDLERASLARFAPPERMVTIPNGLDLAAWRPPRGASRPYVLYAGRLASNKGLARLLSAWALVAPKHPGVDLVLTGRDWGEEARLRAQAARLGLAPRVRFVGHLPDAEYRETMAHARVLVLPSEWEAFGIVLLEAMACGVPCVATRVGGVPEVLEDGREGLLVEPGDEAALAIALDRLLADEGLRAKLGEAGTLKAARFGWPQIAARLESELLALVKR